MPVDLIVLIGLVLVAAVCTVIIDVLKTRD